MPDGSEPVSTLDLRPKRFCVRCSDFHVREEFAEGCETYIGAAPIRKCKTCGGWHALDRWGGNCFPEPNWNRSELPSPQVIRDTLENVTNPLTGKPIDSKRALRAEYRRAGVTEVGNEEQKRVTVEPSEREIAKEVKKQLEILKSDNFSNDQMKNMLSTPAEGAGGFVVS